MLRLFAPYQNLTELKRKEVSFLRWRFHRSRTADGYLYVFDRLKDMVIVGGSNVYCAEVEQVIASHEMVNDAAVIGLPLPGEGEVLIVCVVLRDRGSLDLAQLQAFCEPSLARNKWPTNLLILDQLPRTAVDKVDKKRLRKQLSSSVSEGLS